MPKPILLDSNALFWSLSDPGQLGVKGQKFLRGSGRDIYFSDISLFELAIKKSRGGLKHLDLPTIVEKFSLDSGFHKLSFNAGTADTFIKVPPLHKDPFDRMLIAQALYHNMTIMTADEVFKDYKVDVFLLEG